MLELFINKEDQMQVMEFLDWVECLVQIDRGFGRLESNQCIDIVSFCNICDTFE
jgi:hypothetical protein